MKLGDKLKTIRLEKSMTLEKVSQKSGVSKSLLSQIERNISVPTVITLERITKAYGIATSRLFLELENDVQRSAPPSSKKKTAVNLDTKENAFRSKNMAVVRKEDRKKLILPHSAAEYELLSPDLQRKIEFITVHFPAGAKIVDFFNHKGEECGVILKGKLMGFIGDEVVVLEEGDRIYFDSSIPHRWESVGEGEMKAIWAITPPSF
jgi:transcriptional regulator with XRE-family HTH domain